MQLATDRIEKKSRPPTRTRLVDRYLEQVKKQLTCPCELLPLGTRGAVRRRIQEKADLAKSSRSRSHRRDGSESPELSGVLEHRLCPRPRASAIEAVVDRGGVSDAGREAARVARGSARKLELLPELPRSIASACSRIRTSSTPRSRPPRRCRRRSQALEGSLRGDRQEGRVSSAWTGADRRRRRADRQHRVRRQRADAVAEDAQAAGQKNASEAQ